MNVYVIFGTEMTDFICDSKEVAEEMVKNLNKEEGEDFYRYYEYGVITKKDLTKYF